jgi:L-amino acid N-acyltransferase YncA
MSYVLVPMTVEHRKAVIDIFNHFVMNDWSAYPEEALDYGVYDRFLDMARGYPAFIAAADDGAVVGFGFLHAFLPAGTFRRSAEVTYFIRPEHTRKGIGGRMLEAFMEGARRRGVDNLLASVSSRNGASLDFHRRHGFTECGRMPAVGRKFGEDFDVVWMQRRIVE